ncbi:MAG: hypothetical protein KDM91_14975 [Verrucomicrobiae bacterium]|nr:hypothetical protein [Verrucomicrobiae bacterium]
MSLRLEMLQVARLAPSVLGPEASALIEKFVRSQQNADGGFRDRDGQSDLYYTSFAIDALTALQATLPAASLAAFLAGKAESLGTLDFVHRCCLARLASSVRDESPASFPLTAILDAIEAFRTPDGGYNQAPGAKTGSAYACFLAYGAYSDHGKTLPNAEGVAACLDSLATGDGAWANDTFLPVPNVPATAAAVTLCRNLRLPVPPATADWLLGSFQPESGGFLPFPGAPMPDLLSTAVALHALDGLQAPFGAVRESALDFVDSLWSAEGGFHGTWDDDELDLEYTYYGLLALGHLAL